MACCDECAKRDRMFWGLVIVAALFILLCAKE